MKRGPQEQIKSLHRTLGKMEIALGSISDSIVWTDHLGHIEWCNASFDRLLNRPHIDILGRRIVEIFPLLERGTPLPEKAHPVTILLENRMELAGLFEYEQNGKYLYLEIMGQNVDMPDMDKFMVMVIRDITLTKDIEQFRLQSAALQHAANAIVITNTNGEINWVNQSFTTLSGYSLEEVYGQNMRLLKSGEQDNTFYQHLWETILSGQVWEGDIINRKKDGSIYSEEQTITPVKDNEGQISHFIAIKQDVTDRRKTEKELLKYREQLEQMVEDRTKELKETQQELVNKAIEAGMAHVASMVLHNIGNAITPIITFIEKIQTNELGKILHYLEKCYDDLQSRDDDLDYYIKEDVRGKQVFSYMADLIQSMADKNEEQLEIFKKIETAITYISETLSLQQAYTLIGHEAREVVYLNSLIEDAIEMQTPALEKRRIIVNKKFADNLPKIVIDKNKLMQVVVNLIKNSYEAIDAQNSNTKEKIMLLESFVENDRLVFQITDNGIGIESDRIDKVFEFGKSLKGSSGFGLPYCKMFMESNAGTIILKSNGIGTGAKVSLYFNLNKIRKDGLG